jgi:hypothetical protein
MHGLIAELQNHDALYPVNSDRQPVTPQLPNP